MQTRKPNRLQDNYGEGAGFWFGHLPKDPAASTNSERAVAEGCTDDQPRVAGLGDAGTLQQAQGTVGTHGLFFPAQGRHNEVVVKLDSYTLSVPI